MAGYALVYSHSLTPSHSLTRSLTHSLTLLIFSLDERNFKLFEQMMHEGKAIRRQREEEERVKNGLPPLETTEAMSKAIEGAKENVHVNDAVTATEQTTLDKKWKKIEIEEVDDEALPPTPSVSNSDAGGAVMPPAPPIANDLEELD